LNSKEALVFSHEGFFSISTAPGIAKSPGNAWDLAIPGERFGGMPGIWQSQASVLGERFGTSILEWYQ